MVLEQAENPNPQRELEKMTIDELLVLNDWKMQCRCKCRQSNAPRKVVTTQKHNNCFF